jgi:hypothetical protein
VAVNDLVITLWVTAAGIFIAGLVNLVRITWKSGK